MRRNWATSSLTRRASSSLYSSATRLVYFFFVSESFSNDPPPCRVKKSVAEPLPPTFMVRSCVSCQLSRLVDLAGKKGSDATECTIERSRGVPNKRNMHTHVTVHAGAIETDIQAKRDTSPCWVAGLAVKAHLEAWLAIFYTAVAYAPCFPYPL